MGQIEVMSAALANQIAAGEVVERPASCIKELIENSLDAGATQIRIGLKEGGIQEIRVQDNGNGMDAADAQLAFSRHATSKLKHARDLTRINTLGFRGEALASIAAVAKVSLQTRTNADESGLEVRVEGSTMVQPPHAIGVPVGTTISVAELFFNTPARLKYLRTVQTEQARCVEAVQRAALARPDVAFICEVEGRVLFQTPGQGKLIDVLAALYGIGEARQFIAVSGESPDYRISGYIGRPTQAKSSRAHAHLCINRRPIRNIAVHQAVVNGYHGRLMIGKQPMYSLQIEMDPTLVDVNIHPHKAEVRFSEERDLCLLVQRAVREALDRVFLANHLPTSTLQAAASETPLRTPSEVAMPKTITVQSEIPSFAPSSGTRTSAAAVHYPRGTHSHDAAQVRELYAPQPAAENLAERAAMTAETTARQVDSEYESHLPVEPGQDAKSVLCGLRVIGQAMATYILAENGESLYIIDQHAAHERVLYERFWQRMRDREVRQIPLLTPLTITLGPTEHERLMRRLESVRETGLDVEDFGGNEVIVRAVPDVWEGLDMMRLAEEVIQSLHELKQDANLASALRERIIMRACKSAIKANHRLSNMELQAVCDALADLDDPFHCPHGRPIFIELTERELEKGFRRIV